MAVLSLRRASRGLLARQAQHVYFVDEEDAVVGRWMAPIHAVVGRVSSPPAWYGSCRTSPRRAPAWSGGVDVGRALHPSRVFDQQFRDQHLRLGSTHVREVEVEETSETESQEEHMGPLWRNTQR